ncbi:MAG: hypothetical protein HDS10_01280 [Bacteroides sp.]|nr:hypothetical protein [Bacteroides sp.]
MIEEIKGYVVSCDICDNELGFDGVTTVFDTEKEACKIAIENGWKETEPGKWVCESCLEEFNSED